MMTLRQQLRKATALLEVAVSLTVMSCGIITGIQWSESRGTRPGGTINAVFVGHCCVLRPDGLDRELRIPVEEDSI
jgi:hypothetical protein